MSTNLWFIPFVIGVFKIPLVGPHLWEIRGESREFTRREICISYRRLTSYPRRNDIGPPNNWNNIVRIINQVVPITQFAKPGAFNDLDMLEVGNSGLTVAEQQSHFAFWAAAKYESLPRPHLCCADVLQGPRCLSRRI